MRAVCIAAALIFLLCCVAFSEKPEVSGLVQAQYSDHGDKDSRFLVRAARIKFEAQVTDRVFTMAQFDIARDPVILDAVIHYALLKYANLTVGQFKVPFGFEVPLSRFDLEAIERSLVLSHLFDNGVSGPYLRDIGLMVSGKYHVLNYEVGLFNGTGYNYTEDSNSEDLFRRWGQDNNNTKDVAGRIGMGVPMFAGLGFSFYEGKWGDCGDRDAKGFYIHFDTGKVILQYEYVRGKGRLVEDEWETDKYSGYYLVTGYRIRPLVEPVFKLDKLDPDKDTGGDKLTDFYYGLNLNFERMARLQVFYRDGKVGGKFRDKEWRVQMSAKF